MPWLKKELEASDYQVVEPAMPETDHPVIDTWVSHLSEAVGELDAHTYFVGHSIGCQTILRYLERESDKKAGGCVFVAGWFKLDNLESEEDKEIAQPWLKDNIDFSRVLNTTREFFVINSSNDEYGCIEENKRLFEEKLGAKVVVLENKGHLTEGDGVTKLPEVLKAIQEVANKNEK